MFVSTYINNVIPENLKMKIHIRLGNKIIKLYRNYVQRVLTQKFVHLI